ncbi:hypothetical protein A5733_18635 [Mycobacterium sp. NS-7484]|uniref:hypothetical protein n=1 Tax=Mycobacterium sp. NS-7484 TaxID=1834161 RepID=UPI00096CDA65|nr:hypothetical protein [Mycobacterium sp. NS-7484]OMC05697.1 hypothetical protein A5733_18635 [Mycobacterium sp. NS-7484]
MFELSNRAASKCAVVQSMIEYNKQFDHNVKTNTEAGIETTDSDYRQWAAQLQEFADQIQDDPALGERATKMAELADQTAELVPRARADLSSMPQAATAPPPSAREYSRIAHEFHDNLMALDGACTR